MRYQVPQFIEVEDKIFGPLTAKQFIYLAGGGGVALATFSTLPFFVAVFIAVPIGALAGAMAFYQVNGRPFISVMENAFNFYVRKKLYLWNAQHAQRTTKPAAVAQIPQQQNSMVPRISESKLQDLSWSLNIKDRQMVGVEPSPNDNFKI